MQDLNDKITGNTLSAAEWNEMPSELQNIIEQRGIVLSGADLNQVGKAIAGYVANGSFFVDSGAANAYVLSVVGLIQSPPNYLNGDEIAFYPLNNSTGAACTVDRGAAGVKNLKDEAGNIPAANDIQAGVLTTARFNFAANEFRLVPTFTTALKADLKAGRINGFVNGDFSVVQRGTSFTLSNITPFLGSSEYTLDQWQTLRAGLGGNTTAYTINRTLFPVGQTDVPDNPKHFMNFTAYVAAITNFTNLRMRNSIESVLNYAGKNITLSYWVKGTIAGDFVRAMAQNFGTGGAPSAEVIFHAERVPITTSWVKQTVTIAVPSIAGKTLGTANNDCIWLEFISNIGLTPAGVYGVAPNFFAGYQGTISIADVQIEQGSIATEFERLPLGTVQNLCERYYQEVFMTTSNPASIGQGIGGGLITGQTRILMTEMRAAPTRTLSVATNADCLRLDAAGNVNGNNMIVSGSSGSFNTYNCLVQSATAVLNASYMIRTLTQTTATFSAEI